MLFPSAAQVVNLACPVEKNKWNLHHVSSLNWLYAELLLVLVIMGLVLILNQ